MPRPVMDRRVAALPTVPVFKPAGIPARDLEEVALTLDEFEALRLADYEGLYQEAAALRMGVSRQTFGRIVEAARKKVADALVNGKALRIEGGVAVVGNLETENVKIAIPTREGNVEAHFGHCSSFSIYTVEGSEIVGEETMDIGSERGCKSGIAGELARMGVRKLLAGNIGEGAVRVLGSFGIAVVRGASGSARGAAEAFLLGALTDTGANCSEHSEGHAYDGACTHEG